MPSKRRQHGARRGDELLEAALGYADQGLRVLPLHSPSDGRCSCGNPNCEALGKHPRTRHGLKEATTDQNQIREWWTEAFPEANIGVIPGPRFLVLDVDPRNGGAELLAELEAEHDPLPPSREARTGEYEGERGRHIWFRLPPGRRFGKDRIGSGVERISEGGYVVMPPSLHWSGVRYEWIR